MPDFYIFGWMKYTFLITPIMAITMLYAACKEPRYCTEEFRSICIEISDSLKPDDYFTINLINGDTLHRGNQSQFSCFTLVDDAVLNQLKQSDHEVQFVGLQQGKEVINERYVVYSDGCHVQYKSGKLKIE